MKIKQLRIQSFRGISDLTLDFDDRLNVLIGNNGSGKSSILDSLGALLNSISDLVYTLYVDSNNIIDLKKQRVKNIFLDDDISVKNEKIVVQSEANINLLDFKLIIQKNKKIKESIIQIVNSSSHSELQKFVNSDNIPVLIYY
ncbi:MAG: AAA family ATPase, partial [Pseudanabaena sp.]